MLLGTWAPGLDHWFEYTLGEGGGWGWTPGSSFSIDQESELGATGKVRVRGGSLWVPGASE